MLPTLVSTLRSVANTVVAAVAAIPVPLTQRRRLEGSRIRSDLATLALEQVHLRLPQRLHPLLRWLHLRQADMVVARILASVTNFRMPLRRRQQEIRLAHWDLLALRQSTVICIRSQRPIMGMRLVYDKPRGRSTDPLNRLADSYGPGARGYPASGRSSSTSSSRAISVYWGSVLATSALTSEPGYRYEVNRYERVANPRELIHQYATTTPITTIDGHEQLPDGGTITRTLKQSYSKTMEETCV